MRVKAVLCIFLSNLLVSLEAAAVHSNQVGGAGAYHKRSLQQDFGQFSPLLNTRDTFSGWGGRWELTPTAPPAGAPQQPSPAAGVQNGVRPTTVRTSRTGGPARSSNGVVPNGSSRNGVSHSANRNTISSGSSSTTNEIGGLHAIHSISKPRTVLITNPSSNTASNGVVAAGNAGSPVGAPAITASNAGSRGAAAAGTYGNTGAADQSVNLNIPVNLGAAAEDTESMAALSRSAGIINGRGQPRLTNPAVIATLPRYVAANGSFVGGSRVEFWPSINPDSRVNAVFLEANITNNIPPPDNVSVLDPAPINTSRLPAASFETGYCVPRMAYLVVNVTALACVAGSNLTRWDNEPVCAKLDCSWRSAGTNVQNTASGCRTVVERPKPICPKGCNVIEQWRWNTTVNRTQLFTKCSCRAGNQPCPSTWTACTCYEGLNSQNLTRGFVVCSETQGECDRKCNLAVSGNPRLAPLCPIAMDPFLSITPMAPPIYPMFGWNIASQAASQAATLGVAGRSLKQLVGLGRRLTMAAADWQVQKLMLNARTAAAGDQRVSSSSSSSSGGGGGRAPAAAPEAMQLQTWLQRVCASVSRAVWG